RSISFFPHRLAVDQYLVSKGLLERIDADKTGRISIKKTKKRKVPKMDDPFRIIKREIANG
ncbi:MAG: hypothetical protein ABH829_03240, partial [archaeon]